MKRIKLYEEFIVTEPKKWVASLYKYAVYEGNNKIGIFVKDTSYDTFFINYLQLEDNYRGKNYFKPFMDEIIKIAKKEGYSEIQLKPDESDENLYDKLFRKYYDYGFRPKDDEYEGMFLRIE